jgi:hypothetical protein
MGGPGKTGRKSYNTNKHTAENRGLKAASINIFLVFFEK